MSIVITAQSSEYKAGHVFCKSETVS